MAKKRAFISYDFDNDKALKDFIIGQARLADSPFEVVDTSLKEAAPMKTWEDKKCLFLFRYEASSSADPLGGVLVRRIAHKLQPVAAELLAELRDATGADAILARHVHGPVPEGEVLDNTLVALGESVEPGGEVQSKADLIGHG